MNSPVRLGVSPAAASALTGVFSKRFEALFPCAGALGCAVCLPSQWFLPVYLHENVGLPGLPATASQVRQPLPCLLQSSRHCLAASPLPVAACLHPSYLSS